MRRILWLVDRRRGGVIVPATYSGTGSTSTAGVWTAIVTVDGSDVSSRVVGEIRIDAEEVVRADGRIYHSPGRRNLICRGELGREIGNDRHRRQCQRVAGQRAKAFHGTYRHADAQPRTGQLAILCTDDLQGKIDAMSNSAIDAAIPSSYYSNVIFNSAETGWRRAQDRLSTLASALDLDPSGSLRLTAWAAKVTPDLSFTNAHILDESPGLALASRTALINSIEIDFGYRFPRVRPRAIPSRTAT